MAAITGHDGNVVFAGGYVTNVHAWRITDNTGALDTTPFQPAGDSRTKAVAIGNWEGEYRCHQVATVVTDITATGGYYDTNAHSFSLEIVADDLITTPFGADYNTRISGLLSASGSYDCYIDDGVVLPTHGSTDTLTLTMALGASYSIPVLITSVESRVSADGSDRHLTINWESNGNFTETATPIIAATGAAEFTAEGGREYSGTILITRIGITMTAQRDAAEYTFGFVGNGDLAGA